MASKVNLVLLWALHKVKQLTYVSKLVRRIHWLWGWHESGQLIFHKILTTYYEVVAVVVVAALGHLVSTLVAPTTIVFELGIELASS